MTTIFLSSESKSSLPIVQFCADRNIKLIRQSLISFKALDFEVPADWEVVFFSSPRSFDFFYKQEFRLQGYQKIACIGSETKAHIERFGFLVDFFGDEAGKPDEVGAAFKTWLGNRVALFPQSSISNKSIEKSIPKSLAKPLIVYETINDNLEVIHCAIYIFTSPSNFKSYTQRNTLPRDSKIIAWGETTNQSILKAGGLVDFVLKTSSYSELIEILAKIMR
jgi:uroporphyrinogen-III synthase